MTRRPRILLFGTIQSTFVQDDLAIFSHAGKVRTIDTAGFGKQPGRTLSVILAGLIETCQADIVVSWFADYHSALPAILTRLLRKPFIVIAGGFDVIDLPAIDWGAWVHWPRRLAVKVSFRLATAIWCQSSYTRCELLKRDARLKPEVIYLGIDLESWRNRPLPPKQPGTVLTVGLVYSIQRYWVKGVDRWLNLARHNPHYTFRWIGFTEAMQEYIQDLPPNCMLVKPKDSQWLVEDYADAEIYCQPSRVETFGRSVLESMLFGCLPIVSAHTALPEVVGSEGVSIAQADWDSLDLDRLIRQKPCEYNRLLAQVERFDLSKRRTTILNKLRELRLE